MKRLAIGVVALVASLSGCASARYVQKNPDSGIVAIPENTNVWPTHYEEAAKALIKQHVGQSFEIVEQYEVTVGSPSDPQRYGTNPANPNPTNGSSSGKTEFRIVYRKKPIMPGMPLGAMPAPYGMRPPLPGAGMGAQPAGYIPGSMTGPGPMTPGGMPATGMGGMPATGMGAPPPGGMGMGMSSPNPVVPPVTPAGYPYSAAAPSAPSYSNNPYGR
jgi:hypothetical protein